jgi:hypothetical protein
MLETATYSKSWYAFTKLHGVIFWRTIILPMFWFNLWYCEMVSKIGANRIITYIRIHMSDFTVIIYRCNKNHFSTRIWKQEVHLKHWQRSTRPHVVTSPMTVISMISIVRTSVSQGATLCRRPPGETVSHIHILSMQSKPMQNYNGCKEAICILLVRITAEFYFMYSWPNHSTQYRQKKVSRGSSK